MSDDTTDNGTSADVDTPEEEATPEELEVVPVVEEEDEEDRAAYLGWLFILLLAVIFAILMFWAYNQDDDASSTAVAVTTTVASPTGTPTEVLLSVTDDGSVVISGAVTDEGARRQLVDAAVRIYGSVRVIDELVIDESALLNGGTINTVGLAPHEDPNLALLVDSAKQLGLVEGDMAAGFSDLSLAAVNATADVQTNSVSLAGAFPEQSSIDLFVQTVGGVFGEDNVDGSSLFVDSSTTLQGASLQMSGLVDAGDSRAVDLAVALGAAFPGATVDAGAVQVDTSPAALGRLEEKLRTSIGEEPILFASGSDTIDDASEAIILQIAAAIEATPEVPVEIVGHTDNSGSDALNQSLSEGRARAVLLRLVELGVDPDRLSSRGAGPSEPIADNSTDEGKAANRRIAFEFLGAEG